MKCLPLSLKCELQLSPLPEWEKKKPHFSTNGSENEGNTNMYEVLIKILNLGRFLRLLFFHPLQPIYFSLFDILFSSSLAPIIYFKRFHFGAFIHFSLWISMSRKKNLLPFHNYVIIVLLLHSQDFLNKIFVWFGFFPCRSFASFRWFLCILILFKKKIWKLIFSYILHF